MRDLMRLRNALAASAKAEGFAISEYDSDRMIEDFRSGLASDVIGKFTDENGLSFDYEAKEFFTNKYKGPTTEKAMIAHLKKKYPDVSGTLFAQLIKDLRIESPNYWTKGTFKRLAPADYNEALDKIHSRALVTNFQPSQFYNTERALARLEKYLSGKTLEPLNASSIYFFEQDGETKTNEKLKSFKIKAFKNGRLDIIFADKDQFKKFYADYRKFETERYAKNYAEADASDKK